MTLRLVPAADEPGADSDEDPRDALGYGKPEAHPAVTLEPRLKRNPKAPTHWRFVEADGPAPTEPTSKTCRKCHQPASVLVHDPSDSNYARTHCPKCAGEIRRDMSYPDTRSAS